MIPISCLRHRIILIINHCIVDSKSDSGRLLFICDQLRQHGSDLDSADADPAGEQENQDFRRHLRRRSAGGVWSGGRPAETSGQPATTVHRPSAGIDHHGSVGIFVSKRSCCEFFSDGFSLCLQS